MNMEYRSYSIATKILLFISVFSIQYSVFTNPVLAHILLTDKSIGAVVHVTPEDDPIVGQPSDFFFDLKDKENKFDPVQCECTYEVKQDETILASGNLFAANTTPSLENASFNFTFPEKGLYILTLYGKPLTPGTFSEFTLSDTIRVERTATLSVTETSSGSQFFTSHWIHFAVFGAGLAVFLFLLFFKVKREN